MFETENVQCYLSDAYPDIDGEKRVLKLRCYVNPVSYELAEEVDPAIASTLFHRIAGEMIPRPVLNHCRFASNIAPHSLTFCRDPEFGNSRAFIPAVSISKLEAGKVIPESNDFALMFTVTFDIHDKSVLGDISDLLHEKFFLTFAELQPNLFDGQDPVMDLLCRLCDAPNPEHATIDGKFAYCETHSANIQEGERLKRIRDAVKAAGVVRGLREPGEEEFQEEERTDPLAEEGAFINKRAKAKKRR